VNVLNVEQKKGDAGTGNLDGRITVYAVVDIDPEELLSTKHSFASMVHNGFLVAQGNFRDQYNFRDFLKSEMGISLEDGLGEGLSQLIERMDGLESTLDPQKLKERLENMDDIEDFIPTPAKIVPFHSEEEILGQEGDVFFVGTFRNVGNAVLAVQALPMLYQARYREHEVGRIKSEIESIISQIENSAAAPRQKNTTEDTLLKEFFPNMLYNRKDPRAFKTAETEFREFMKQYRFHEDVDAIVSLMEVPRDLTEKENRLLELYAKKIVCVKNENFSAAEDTNREIQRLRGEL
jgi:hypothetical protein